MKRRLTSHYDTWDFRQGANVPAELTHRDGYEGLPTTRVGIEESRRLVARQATMDDMAAALRELRRETS